MYVCKYMCIDIYIYVHIYPRRSNAAASGLTFRCRGQPKPLSHESKRPQ